MRRTSLCLILGVSLLWAGIAGAAPPQLKGEYAFTGEASCLFAPFGFYPNLTPIDDKVFSNSFSVHGIRTFDGHGNGTAEGIAVVTVPPPTPQSPGLNFPPDANSHRFSFQFTYTVDNDGTISTQMVPGTFTSIFLTGPRAGLTFTVDQFTLVGTASKDNKVLTLATPTTEVETHTYNNADGSTNVWPAVCHRSRVLIWLGK
jgi:hypothetical protein